MKNILVITVLLLILYVFLAPAFADEGTTLTVPIEKTTVITGGPAEYIKTIYEYAIGIGGLLAMAIIVFGGIVYVLQQGNIAKQLDAKDMIISAVFGLVLLLSATLILSTISPNLVLLENPELAEITRAQGTLAKLGDAYRSEANKLAFYKQKTNEANDQIVSAKEKYNKVTNDPSSTPLQKAMAFRDVQKDRLAYYDANLSERDQSITALTAREAQLIQQTKLKVGNVLSTINPFTSNDGILNATVELSKVRDDLKREQTQRSEIATQRLNTSNELSAAQKEVDRLSGH